MTLSSQCYVSPQIRQGKTTAVHSLTAKKFMSPPQCTHAHTLQKTKEKWYSAPLFSFLICSHSNPVCRNALVGFSQGKASPRESSFNWTKQPGRVRLASSLPGVSLGSLPPHRPPHPSTPNSASRRSDKKQSPEMLILDPLPLPSPALTFPPAISSPGTFLWLQLSGCIPTHRASCFCLSLLLNVSKYQEVCNPSRLGWWLS